MKKPVFLLLLSGALLMTLIAQESEKVELKLKLPKPMFIGTPRNIRSGNLEPISGKPRGPFLVPQGTRLLSLKKPVTASAHRRREIG
jgi:hypothetical protein